MDTPTGVRKINENVLQHNRAIIITDKDKNNYDFNSLPDGSIFVDTKTGFMAQKLEGQTDWVPANVKNDNTVCILKDSSIISETFTIKSIDVAANTFVYETDLGQRRTGKIDANGYFIFTLDKGSYIPNRNHLNIMLDGVLSRSSVNGDITEMDDKRFSIHDDFLGINSGGIQKGLNRALTVTYINWIRIGNPYPRIFMKNDMPAEAEVGDIWLDLDGDVGDNDILDDITASANYRLDWNNISNRPSTIDGYGITDASRVNHVHAVKDITDFATTSTPVMNANKAKNSDALQGKTIGTGANQIPSLDGDGKIPTSVLPANYGFISGMIMNWYGEITAVPSGWHICDGSNGTPDLRDKFVVGAGGAYSLRDTGGSKSKVLTINDLPSHNHTASGSTNVTGNHHHGTWGEHYLNATPFGIYDGNQNHAGSAGGTDWDDIIYNTSTDGNHSHTFNVTTNSIGSANPTAIDLRPPYYALFYIMKL